MKCDGGLGLDKGGFGVSVDGGYCGSVSGFGDSVGLGFRWAEWFLGFEVDVLEEREQGREREERDGRWRL